MKVNVSAVAKSNEKENNITDEEINEGEEDKISEDKVDKTA
jgi:hypothetical protein